MTKLQRGKRMETEEEGIVVFFLSHSRRSFCTGFKRGTILAAVFALWASVTQAQEPTDPRTLTTEQLRAETTRLKSETEALIQSPDAPSEWKELKAAEKEIEDRRKSFYQEEQAMRERLNPLMQVPQVGGWRKRVYDLQGRYYALSQEDQRRTRVAGYDLYDARHKELAALAPTDTAQLRQLGFDVLTYPRMDGSTSTQPLATLIASRCFQTRCEWVGKPEFRNESPWGLYGEASLTVPSLREPEFDLAEFTMKAQPDEGATQRLAPIINYLLATNASTNAAYVNLIEGQKEIGLLARGPSPDELELARKKNVEIETVPVALDAFVFLVNEANPVKNLTTAQIRDAYSGHVVSWKDLGGAEQAIVPYQRERNSGSQELMVELVMKDLPFITEKDEYGRSRLINYGMGGPFVALTKDVNGLAYSVYYYEHYMAGSPRTRVIAVDGVEPTYDTLRTRKYPFTTEVLAVTRKGLAPDAPAARLREWLLSPEGQAVVRESGYVPIAPSAN